MIKVLGWTHIIRTEYEYSSTRVLYSSEAYCVHTVQYLLGANADAHLHRKFLFLSSYCFRAGQLVNVPHFFSEAMYGIRREVGEALRTFYKKCSNPKCCSPTCITSIFQTSHNTVLE
jgi:hypothetical protein